MKRFRTITAVCLAAIAILVAANVWYLYSLYNSIKEQTLLTVSECVRRADILEILNRFKEVSPDMDDSFIKMSIMLVGEKSENGEYEYPDLLGKLGQTMSEYFHEVERIDTRLPERNYEALDSIFRVELNRQNLYPEKVSILPYEKDLSGNNDSWTIDFSVSEKSSPIYKVYISSLNRHILKRMAGIILTSSGILILMAFLIWYLLRWVGRLRTIEQMKDDFTHNMTHELKTPVAVAYSAADSMLRYYDQSDEARNRQFLKIIMQRLSYLSGMIENILSMSMERFKTMKLNMESVVLKPLVEEVAGMMELKADKPVSIEIDIPEDLSIQSDSLHLGNILSNLIDNAFKYSGETVRITIKADARSITIEDNGIGIDKKNLPFIFDKFYRVSSGDRYETGGYGLGLFYVKKVIELMRWSIGVTSRQGEGAKFTIKFDDDEER